MFLKRLECLNKKAGTNSPVLYDGNYRNDNFRKMFAKEQNKISEEFNKVMNKNKNPKTINKRNEE